MKAGALISLLLGIASLGGVVFTVDARYQHSDAARVMQERIMGDEEEDRINNELELAKLEQAFLLTQKQTAERDARLDYLRSRISNLEARLLALQSK